MERLYIKLRDIPALSLAVDRVASTWSLWTVKLIMDAIEGKT